VFQEEEVPEEKSDYSTERKQSAIIPTVITGDIQSADEEYGLLASNFQPESVHQMNDPGSPMLPRGSGRPIEVPMVSCLIVN